ncbi:uncharacterized protein BDW43DRAFT_20433 [Aspergillus alliaceus]|uniref:uncharacterized protein n=1 Tax=Petromyces alliaceus TaxID=209559 RepID=UPI0012A65ED4|nr:uncharacterized protein BDW43DRAFT_20433 [Aspergillus alliaceus]KAB8236091.1 hypothetical protein BDW43DRAFT_20433 [Aspergillus alliaceus]
MESRLPTRDTRKRESDSHEPSSTSKRPYGATMDPQALRGLGEALKILPVPTDTDDLETTSRKMQDLARVVMEGNSLALWTGLRMAPKTSSRDPEASAKAQMALSEQELYERWEEMQKTRNGRNENDTHPDKHKPLVIPEFDWDKNKTSVPTGAHSVRKFTQRAAAMDIVWGHQGATPEHASWLTFNMPSMLPLIKAITKISNIQKHIQDADPLAGKLTDMEAAEIETVRRAVAIAEGNRIRELERIRKLAKSICESAAVLKSRAQELEKFER